MVFLRLLTVLVSIAVVVGQPNRSPYVPGAWVYPGVLPQFTSTTTTTTTTPAAPVNATAQIPMAVPLQERFGASTSTTVAPGPMNGPIVDQDLLNRVPQWPDEHKPFWFLNMMQLANFSAQPFPLP